MTTPKRLTTRLLFEPRDLWVGVYWNKEASAGYHRLDVYVCAIPLLPLRLTWHWYTTEG
jgi:hypothetical protein